MHLVQIKQMQESQAEDVAKQQKQMHKELSKQKAKVVKMGKELAEMKEELVRVQKEYDARYCRMVQSAVQ